MPVKRICCSRSSSATMQGQGQPRLHRPCLNLRPPPFIPEEKPLRSMTAIEAAIVWRREPGNSCMLVVKMKMARHSGHGSPGWLVTRDPLASASCVSGYRCVLPCLQFPFLKNSWMVPTFLLCSTLSLLSASSSSNVHLLLLAFFTCDSLMFHSGHLLGFPS